MERLFKSYLRAFRRSRGLTQKELAFLIGAESSTTVSRLEQLKRLPNLAVAFACRVIFDTSELRFFQASSLRSKRPCRRGPTSCIEELQGDPSVATRVKLDFLENILDRRDRTPDADI